jgi:hypothetical protein
MSYSCEAVGARTYQKRGARMVRRLVISALLATFLPVLLVAGCSRDVVDPGGPTYTAGSSTTVVISAESFYVRWGETATVVEGVAIAASAPLADPETEPVHAGRVVLYSVVEMTNGGDEPFSYKQADFYLYADLGFSVGGVDGSLTPSGEAPPLASGTLEPGQTVRGAVAFELTTEAVPTIERLAFIRLAPPVTWMVEWSGE